MKMKISICIAFGLILHGGLPAQSDVANDAMLASTQRGFEESRPTRPAAEQPPITAVLTAPPLSCWSPGTPPKLTVTISGSNPHTNTGNGSKYFLGMFYDDLGHTIPSNPSMTTASFSALENTPTDIAIDFPGGVPTLPLTKTFYLDVWGNDYVHNYNIRIITVTINRSPTVTLPPDISVCIGGGANLGAGATVWGGLPSYSYAWTPAASNLSNPSVLNCTATNMQLTTTFTLTATDNLGCSGTDNIAVKVSQVTANAGPDRNICAGSTTQTIGLPATGGFPAYSYSWSPATGLSNPAIYNPVVTIGAPGAYTYTLAVTDASGCSASDQVAVTILTANDPVANAGPDLPGSCSGSPATLNGSASAGTPPYQYSWKNGTTPIASTASATVSPTAPTTYTFRVTDANGCFHEDQASVLSIFPNPVINGMSPNGTQYRCLNGVGIQLTVSVIPSSGAPPFSYLWSPAAGLNDPAVANPLASPVTGTNYTVTVTDSKGCTDLEAAPKIAVFTAPPDVDFYFDKTCCPFLEFVHTTKVHASLGDGYTFNHPAGVPVWVPYGATADWNNGPGVIPEFGWNPVYYAHPYFPVGYRDISVTVKTYDSSHNLCYSASRTKSAYVLPPSPGGGYCSGWPPIASGSVASACGTFTGTAIGNDRFAVTVNTTCPTVISNGARATYIGGPGGVTLNPDFEAVPGSNFWAFIGTDLCMPKN